MGQFADPRKSRFAELRSSVLEAGHKLSPSDIRSLADDLHELARELESSQRFHSGERTWLEVDGAVHL